MINRITVTPVPFRQEGPHNLPLRVFAHSVQVSNWLIAGKARAKHYGWEAAFEREVDISGSTTQFLTFWRAISVDDRLPVRGALDVLGFFLQHAQPESTP